jgi:hypothetical protein
MIETMNRVYCNPCNVEWRSDSYVSHCPKCMRLGRIATEADFKRRPVEIYSQEELDKAAAEAEETMKLLGWGTGKDYTMESLKQMKAREEKLVADHTRAERLEAENEGLQKEVARLTKVVHQMLCAHSKSEMRRIMITSGVGLEQKDKD